MDPTSRFKVIHYHFGVGEEYINWTGLGFMLTIHRLAKGLEDPPSDTVKNVTYHFLSILIIGRSIVMHSVRRHPFRFVSTAPKCFTLQDFLFGISYESGVPIKDDKRIPIFPQLLSITEFT